MKKTTPSKDHIIKRLWKYLKKDHIKLSIVTIMVLCTTITSILSPLLLSIIVDKYLGNGVSSELFKFCMLLGCMYAFTSLFRFLSNFIMVKVSEGALYRLRRDVFNHLQKLSLSFFDRNKKGDLMSRFTNDISIISDALSEAVIEIISSVIMLIGVTAMMFILNPIMAITTILTVPIFFFLVLKIGLEAEKYFNKQQNDLGKLNAYSEEMMTGMKVIKSYNKETESVQDFEQHNHQLRDVSIKAELYSNLVVPANIVVSNLGYVLIIAVGAIMTVNGKSSIGEILAFITYSSMFRQPINQLASLYASIQSALAGARRVFEILDTKIEVKDVKNPTRFDRIEGKVDFYDVTFAYNEKKTILKDINVSVKPGEAIALVGPTGAGKTTIINLLTRFYDINEGTIMIDDIDIATVKQDDLRHKIGIVLQDNYLFKGTVKENIKYGNIDATDEQVIEASKKARAHQFIHRLPNGYESLVEEEGSNFSEGERQLIAIARAILADPDILILDEATSNVDTRTELALNQGMKELMKDRTSFVIAHRLSTIESADTILVLDHGQIIERGKHQELLEKKGFYYNLYMSQFE